MGDPAAAPSTADVDVEPGVSVPLRVPRRDRLRALAILSVLIFVLGVSVASALLLVIVTLARALSGV